MKKFKKIEFTTSYASSEKMPHYKYEIALVGPSNVGKSSFINHLFNTKIAKTSSIPGKTQTFNLYLIDNKISLIDLPGYGFAKIPKLLQKQIFFEIDQYFKTRKHINLVLFFHDIRHNLTKSDIEFLQWLAYSKVPFFIIFTKTDKTKNLFLNTNAKQLLEIIEKITQAKNPLHVYYSIKNKDGRNMIFNNLNIFFGDN